MKLRPFPTGLASLLLILFFSGASAKDKFQFYPDSTKKSVKVFLNCPNSWCWQDYLRTQTTWAYFVQDQFVADVNLRINSLENGSGGSQYKLIFEGLGKIAHLQATMLGKGNTYVKKDRTVFRLSAAGPLTWASNPALTSAASISVQCKNPSAGLALK